MTFTRLIIRSIAIASILAMGFSGFAQRTPDDVLVVGINADPITLDPHASTSMTDRNYYYQLFDPLFRLTPDLEIAPGLVASWETPSPTTYLFTLQEGVTFHDGTALDAEAVVWNFERMLDPDNSLPRRSEVNVISDIEAVDALTVRIELSAPYAPFLSVLTDRSGMMVSPTAVQSLGEDFPTNPVGAGPFMFSEWDRNSQLTFTANPNYWQDGLPRLSAVQYRIFPDPTVRLTNLRTGSVDIVDSVPPQSLASIENSADFALYPTPGLGYEYLDLNTVRPPFDETALRQAVAWGIDRASMVTNILRGTAVVADGPCPASLWCHDPDFEPYTRDPEQVARALAEAGVPDGFSFELIMANDSIDQTIGQLLQAQLADVGIDMTIRTVDASALSAALRSGEYEAMLVGWSGRSDPDGNLYVEFKTDAPVNFRKWSDPDVDRLLEEGRASLDQEERYEIYREMQDLIAEGSPLVFLYTPTWIHATATKVGDYEIVPDGRFRFATVTKASD